MSTQPPHAYARGETPRDQEHAGVVVGVDGSAAALTAVRYAAAEAVRTDEPLSIVHVTPAEAGRTGARPRADAEHGRLDDRVLDEARQVARESLAGARISTRLVHGGRVECLLAQVTDGQRLVLGDRRRWPLGDVATDSVLAAVAGRSGVRMTFVPESWSPGPVRIVAAGVKHCVGSQGLVQRLFEVASGRDAELEFVHAWELDTAYDDTTAERVGAERWEYDTRSRLGAVVDRVAESFPQVTYRVLLVRGRPAKVLERVSSTCDLLVLARRSHAYPHGYLGPIGRGVLRTARCPVEILPPGFDPVWAPVREDVGPASGATPARARR